MACFESASRSQSAEYEPITPDEKQFASKTAGALRRGISKVQISVLICILQRVKKKKGKQFVWF